MLAQAAPDGASLGGEEHALWAEGAPSRQGLLGIRNGQLVYEPPEGLGAYPILEPGEGVSVYLNGRLLTAPMVVFPVDTVRFELPERRPETRVRVDISEDGLVAELVVERQAGLRYGVADAPPRPRLRPRAVVQGPLEPPPASPQQARAELERAGVRFGIDEEAVTWLVQQANAEPLGGTFRAVVARGIAPVPPRPASLQLLGPLTPGSLVVEGQPVARKLPAVPGRPGISVFDKPVPVAEPADPPLVAGPGCLVAPDGCTVVAARGGRLYARGFTVWVQTVQEIRGDVEAARSPVRFPGDIVIFGQCLPGSQVLASGRLEVHGSVDSAQLQAGQSIHVAAGVFRSTLLCGAVEGAEVVPLMSLLQLISVELGRLSDLVEQASRRSGIPAQELAARTLEVRGGALRQALGRLRQEPSRHLLPEGLLERLVSHLLGLGAVRQAHPETWLLLKAHVDAARDVLEGSCAGGADIVVAYAHNSLLRASGSIQLTGRGSYQAQLHAGGGIAAPEGAVVGGEAVALGGDIVCRTLGGERSVTFVAVGAPFAVRAQQVIPDVVIQIGGRKHRVTQAQQNVAYTLEGDRIAASFWHPRRARGREGLPRAPTAGR